LVRVKLNELFYRLECGEMEIKTIGWIIKEHKSIKYGGLVPKITIYLALSLFLLIDLFCFHLALKLTP